MTTADLEVGVCSVVCLFARLLCCRLLETELIGACLPSHFFLGVWDVILSSGLVHHLTAEILACIAFVLTTCALMISVMFLFVCVSSRSLIGYQVV